MLKYMFVCYFLIARHVSNDPEVISMSDEVLYLGLIIEIL